MLRPALAALAALAAAAATRSTTGATAPDRLPPAEVFLGDRLFRETRFAQFFYARCRGDLNTALPQGDPVVDTVETSGRPFPGPFRGQSINCRHCHLGDDFLASRPLAGRTYADFSRRSRVPSRRDQATRTTRNSPMMVDLMMPAGGASLFHFDGEFAQVEDLVIATMTGRNFGWLPGESAMAKAHVAAVIRQDDGRSRLARRYSAGHAYAVVLRGDAPTIPPFLRLPAAYRLNVASASEDRILEAVASLMDAYMRSLRFGPANLAHPAASPYDMFLTKNSLPDRPEPGESEQGYAGRLRTLIAKLPKPAWVTPEDASFKLHDQRFAFGPVELAGLKVFLSTSRKPAAQSGNCVSCHPPPRFTDHDFHNNGASQREYDATHGEGAFEALKIPDLNSRNRRLDAYLPPSPVRPYARGRFRSAPSRDRPELADLGVWNVLANPDMPKPQQTLMRLLCRQSQLSRDACAPAEVLPLAVGYFKTPTLRDLGQSAPYFHAGSVDTVEGAVRFYVGASGLMRAGRLRNGSPELAHVRIDDGALEPLVAFLKALNEDYH